MAGTARIVLLSAAGKMNQEIARQLGLTNATVSKWRRRFVEQGVAGLHDELRPGRPRPISDERVARLVRQTLETKPKDGTHWSIRQMAEQTRISKSTVHRIWQIFGLEPHRQRHFKLSTDPFFDGNNGNYGGPKVRDRLCFESLCPADVPAIHSVPDGIFLVRVDRASIAGTS